MSSFREKMRASPIYARVAPFVIFILLTASQSMFGEAGKYWIYLGKTLVGAWLIWEMRALVPEMRWEVSTEAIAVGVAVCIMWIGIDGFYSHMGSSDSPPWNPRAQFGEHSTLAMVFIWGRVLGSTFVVPPLEEVFFRSFLYRYFVRTDFEKMPFSRFHPTSFIVTSTIFGFEHSQWFAGILCGFAYQWLAISKNRLGDAIAAHAITNFLLGLWVIGRGAWQFW
jgi:CAAX prenyl protease-like protein